ncbi:LysE family translocator, partial [Amaricoccus sp. HAR-UPW-R2A-40]
MNTDILFALFVASFVNAALPGPCMIATMGRTLRGGWRKGALVSLGVLAADTLHIAAAIAALLGVLSLSPAALIAMKWAGIAA